MPDPEAVAWLKEIHRRAPQQGCGKEPYAVRLDL
jgi:hypothetical protein